MNRTLTESLAAVALSTLCALGASPAYAAPAPVQPIAESGSASGSAQTLLAFPLGFVLFGACFADGPTGPHNPLCQALLDLTTGSYEL